MSNAFLFITPLHVVFLLGVLVILATMIFRKDTPLICICFLFLFGLVGTGTLIGGIQTIFSAILYAFKQFSDIMITIALITALSKCLSDLKSDYLLMAPMSKIMKNTSLTWWILGIAMFLFSLFLWPSPAVALVGAIMVPFAIKEGLSPIMAAVAMNLFGHGLALSGDYVIQGAPAISAAAASISTNMMLTKGCPLFITMSITTAIAAYCFHRKEITNKRLVSASSEKRQYIFETRLDYKKARILAWITPISFVLDIVFLLIFSIRGQDATALVTGTAVLLLVFGSFLGFGKKALEKVTSYVQHGFLFAIEIFAPVVIIGAFFFLGGEGLQQIVSDQYRNGILNDWALCLAHIFPINSYITAFLSLGVGALTGLDGSGFSGLPLTGALAQTFGIATNTSVPILASLGQIGAIYVGGGTIVPWGLIPVAAICHVNPLELARKNLIPVCIGFGCTLLLACILIFVGA